MIIIDYLLGLITGRITKRLKSWFERSTRNYDGKFWYGYDSSTYVTATTILVFSEPNFYVYFPVTKTDCVHKIKDMCVNSKQFREKIIQAYPEYFI
jgi:hypothetical protein